MILIVTTLVLGGISLTATGLAQALGKISPGSSLGLRIPSTSRGVQSWYAGQKASAPVLILVGLVWIAAGIIIPFLAEEVTSYYLMGVIFFSLPLAVVGILRGHRAAVEE